MSSNRCQCCDQVVQRGYRINPRTGQQEPKRIWCASCYERIVARSTRYVERPAADDENDNHKGAR